MVFLLLLEFTVLRSTTETSLSASAMGSTRQRSLFRLTIVFLLVTSASSSVVIAQQPNISLTSHNGGRVWGPGYAEITRGNSFVIECSISPQNSSGFFQLNSSEISVHKSAGNYLASFEFHAAEFKHEGNYSCVYVTRKNTSSPSAQIGVIITVIAQQPNISLKSHNGGLVWRPGYAEITRGYSFVIECSILPDNSRGFFQLISDSNITDTKSAVNYSASFNFPAAEYEHQGSYSCVYEVTWSTGKNTSSPSAPIRVIITVPLWLVLSLVTSGVLLLLLLLLLVLCVVHRRRQQMNQTGEPILNQITIRNSYDEDDEDDAGDEDKRDYVNIELFNPKSEQIDEVGGTAEEDDDDCDYVNMETENNYIACVDLFGTGEDKEEEEDDEESSDDENDYVNAPDLLTHSSHLSH